MEVFEFSAKDGGEINKQVVPTIFGRALLDTYGGIRKYTVQPGGTLFAIVQQFYGDDIPFPASSKPTPTS